MIIGARPEVGPMAVFASILLTMSVALSTAACASASPDRSRLPQLRPPGRIAGVIPGSWERIQGLQLGSPQKRLSQLSRTFNCSGVGDLLSTMR